MHRYTLLFLTLCAVAQTRSAAQEPTVYAAVMTSGAFVVGAANSGTGLYMQTPSQDTVWKHTGPARIRANAMAVDAGSGGRVLYIAAGNGLHRSTDAGEHWRTLTDWRVTEVLDVVLDPFDTRRILIATAYGVFRSSDAGETWRAVNSGRAAPYYTPAILADRHTRDRYYCAAEDGLYVSSNGGQSWRRSTLPRTQCATVAAHPVVPGLLAAGSEGSGLWISSDAGRTWNRAALPAALSIVYAITFDPSDPTVIYAGGKSAGIWSTRDGGASWTMAAGTEGWSVDALAVDPTHPARLYAGVVWLGFRRSDDGGRTWNYAGLLDSHAAAITILP